MLRVKLLRDNFDGVCPYDFAVTYFFVKFSCFQVFVLFLFLSCFFLLCFLKSCYAVLIDPQNFIHFSIGLNCITFQLAF